VALGDAVDLLVCPICPQEDEAALQLVDRTVRCERQHSFDVARQGYLNLLRGPPPAHADTPAMIAARDRVLSGPVYQPLLEAVASATRAVLTAFPGDPPGTDNLREAGRTAAGGPFVGAPGPAVLDCGSGTGHYLAAALTASSVLTAAAPAAQANRGVGARGIGADVSVAAARRTARWPLPIGAVVADVWRGLPVRTGSIAVVLSVFAPRQVAEFVRVLASGGAVVTAHPRPEHLVELRRRLGLIGLHPQKSERLEAAFDADFALSEQRLVQYGGSWTAATVRDVVAMGPNAFHRSTERDPSSLAAQYEDLDGVEVTVAVEITTWLARS
jgi:23S rRNA (guanine745-N1)-methyltransferase